MENPAQIEDEDDDEDEYDMGMPTAKPYPTFLNQTFARSIWAPRPIKNCFNAGV